MFSPSSHFEVPGFTPLVSTMESTVVAQHFRLCRLHFAGPWVSCGLLPGWSGQNRWVACLEIAEGGCMYIISLHLCVLYFILIYYCSPPVRWGLLDFMSALTSSSSFSSSAFAFSFVSSCDPVRPVFRTGPQPRSCEFSVPRRTSTAILWVQCSAPDLNRDPVSSVFRAGPQPRSCEASVPRRTSTAILWGQCSAPDLNREMCQKEECQKDCQKICQKECQKICQKECQKICQKECQKICQKECQKICQKECQKICQK